MTSLLLPYFPTLVAYIVEANSYRGLRRFDITKPCIIQVYLISQTGIVHENILYS